ncbi:methylamine utilization protein [Aquibium carbonis]|uniref:Methylamine utilization protein n=1 Tax=Aquibium carbonis TaxID=2495581 RepID=A0A3R9Y5G6_9HYPH|nr:cytochrome c peroxidase [Aquibium carbonis]RST83463.1 methylamine utilization protein [Aquibium carbonis]
MRPRLLTTGVALAALLLAGACKPSNLSEGEARVVATLSLAALPLLPADPSNRVADDPAAAALGEALFFDHDLSADGSVSCASCHQPTRRFQDGIARAIGIGEADRRTMPLEGVAWSPWQFWDGRADSLWAQALGPWENPVEHGGNRVALVRQVANAYRDEYEAVFGPLPDLTGLPEDTSPLGSESERAAWAGLTDDERGRVDRVYSNMGKAVAAFERTIAPVMTRFDRFAEAVAAGRRPEGEAALSDLELEGLKLFMGEASCVNCHNGPRFTDDHFHNTGVPAVPGLPPDRGRADAVAKVLADPFNCLGAFSDTTPEQCGEIRFMVRDGEALERAFKTPSLRGVAGRAPYMHAGQIATLEEVVDHYASAPEAPSGRTAIEGFVLTDRGRMALIAFLNTLEPMDGKASHVGQAPQEN